MPKLVTFPRVNGGEVHLNPETVSDVRTDPDGKVVIRLTNGASYKLDVATITDVTSAIQATDG